jgi:hypothetical protein
MDMFRRAQALSKMKSVKQISLDLMDSDLFPFLHVQVTAIFEEGSQSEDQPCKNRDQNRAPECGSGHERKATDEKFSPNRATQMQRVARVKNKNERM